MKKFFAIMLCLAMMLACLVSLAEDAEKITIGTVYVNGAFELKCAVPEGYVIREMESPRESGLLARWIGTDDPTRPAMVLFIAYDELLSQVNRLNDLDEAALAQIEASFTDDNDVEINYMETAHGTKLMFVRSGLEEVDFIDFYTIYQGYEIEFMMAAGMASDEALTDEQIQMAVDFLSDLDFMETEAPAPSFTGFWFDQTSQRAVMELEELEDGLYQIVISWSSNAWETTEWRMTGALTEENQLTYVDGSKVNVTYAEDGSVTNEELLYANAEGALTLAENVITWADSMEETASAFVFEQERE